MYSHESYSSYGYRLRHYFASGLSKIIDLGNYNHIDYPKYMTDSEANVFDKNELKKDFEIVGEDIRKALDFYGTTHTL